MKLASEHFSIRSLGTDLARGRCFFPSTAGAPWTKTISFASSNVVGMARRMARRETGIYVPARKCVHLPHPVILKLQLLGQLLGFVRCCLFDSCTVHETRQELIWLTSPRKRRSSVAAATVKTKAAPVMQLLNLFTAACMNGEKMRRCLSGLI